MYYSIPKEIPDTYWIGTLISVIKNTIIWNRSFIYVNADNNNISNSYFFTEYWQMVFTSQVSIVQIHFHILCVMVLLVVEHYFIIVLAVKYSTF